MDKHEEYEMGLRKLFASRGYRPMRSRDMAYQLGIPRKEFSAFRGVLEELRGEGIIQRGKDARWRLPGAGDKYIIGTIDIAMAGHAFVLPDDREEADVFVPPDRLLDAFDGDRVKVRVSESDRRGDRRASGEVVAVVERARDRLVGTMLPSRRAIIEDPRNRYEFDIVLSPDTPAKSASQAAKSQRRRRNAEQAGLNPGKASIRLTVGKDDALPPAGQKVLLHILGWPNDPGGPKAEIIEVLGPSGDPDTETAAILAENNAPGPFPEAVLQAARRLDREIDPAERARLLDCTEDICCTIDPPDARDFDDALGLKENADGTFTVDVHIADVARYVQPGDILDVEARDRSTSIYLPERVIPMLPEEISNDICSLRPDEERPAKTVRLHYSAEGERLGYTIHRSLIRSRRRFTYNEVRDLVEFSALRDEFEDKELLRCVLGLHDLAMKLRRRRLAGGAIELNLAEYRVVIDSDGQAVAMVKV
ncbi:MAG: ribonuclease R [Planctomycetes bacterium]|nr:ribonuclease R [Planctomycetota bacterium]